MCFIEVVRGKMKHSLPQLSARVMSLGQAVGVLCGVLLRFITKPKTHQQTIMEFYFQPSCAASPRQNSSSIFLLSCSRSTHTGLVVLLQPPARLLLSRSRPRQSRDACPLRLGKGSAACCKQQGQKASPALCSPSQGANQEGQPRLLQPQFPALCSLFGGIR